MAHEMRLPLVKLLDGVGGPPFVQWAQGQKVSKEELGGYRIHTRLSNVIDNEAESEENAIDQAKKFLAYLPSNVWEMPQRKYVDQDDINRREEELLSIIPRNGKKTYDMRRLMECGVNRSLSIITGR